MAIEIERRFLVTNPGWRDNAQAAHNIAQAYLFVIPDMSVRVRIKNDEAAWLTIKSGKASIERAEFEYEIPVKDAEELIKLRTGIVIEKQRHIVVVGADRWEVDVFSGDL